MKKQAEWVANGVRNAVGYTARQIKPVVRGTVRWALEHPEAAIAGGVGYMLGGIVDRTPLIGRLTQGNGKWLMGAAGLAYGYNKALLRRQIRTFERRSVQAHIEQ